ncbi:CPBP family intramembrane metalloprotease [Corynebacterium sp. YIM 101645]|uniref:CPBP family intramembrane metalloprotease n=1 Tax=Corynebacterium lemuris TaxID=1859292 RepID=A0ABT2FXG6_9CORY|nr:CPBP family intramembrane glutamic endopeptidase [Corynebacterium lemuris]MCS5479938.1 CPBP family intramembrane metalloprotease [Corynebacterium lemuris]
MAGHQIPLTKAPAVRSASPGMLVPVVGLDLLLVSLIILLLRTGALTPVTDATAGLINRSLLGNALPLLLVVGILILRLGGLRARDIGLIRAQLPFAIAVTAGIWALVQVIQVGSALLVDGRVQLAAQWSGWGSTAVVGTLLGQLFGNALYEELVYRGFLFTQVLLRLRQRWPASVHRPWVAALLISQFLFAIRHIPSALAGGMGATDIGLELIRLTVLGILLALLYVRTANLFIVIGVHALMDAPTALVSSSIIDAGLLVLLLAVLLLGLWPGRKSR